MIVAIPWPHYPSLTGTGKPSLAKTAGKPVPWLSANVVNNLHPARYREIKEIWRETAQMVAKSLTAPFAHPLILHVILYKRTAQKMDSFAILEGMKPIIDGLVLAGLLPDDSSAFVIGGVACAHKAAPDGLGVLVNLLPASSVVAPPPPATSPSPRPLWPSVPGTASE